MVELEGMKHLHNLAIVEDLPPLGFWKDNERTGVAKTIKSGYFVTIRGKYLAAKWEHGGSSNHLGGSRGIAIGYRSSNFLFKREWHA